MVAMRQHRSRQRTTKAPTDVTLKSKGPFSDERNHPNPSFEKEGLKIAFVRGEREPSLRGAERRGNPERRATHWIASLRSQ